MHTHTRTHFILSPFVSAREPFVVCLISREPSACASFVCSFIRFLVSHLRCDVFESNATTAPTATAATTTNNSSGSDSRPIFPSTCSTSPWVFNEINSLIRLKMSNVLNFQASFPIACKMCSFHIEHRMVWKNRYSEFNRTKLGIKINRDI